MSIVQLDLNPDRTVLRQFGFIALFAFAALGGFVLWRGGLFGFSFGAGPATVVAWVFFGLSALCGLLSLVAPPALRPIYVGLILLTFPIGFVVSHVILALLYYAILTPVGLVMRAAGHDPMKRRFEPGASTYWEAKAPVTDPKAYFRQY